jgi:hypothetical protein
MEQKVLAMYRYWLNRRYYKRKYLEQLGFFLARLCPVWLRYFITIDVCAKATTGAYSAMPADIDIFELLKRTDKGIYE